MEKYNPKEIEPKWQKYWTDQKTFEVGEDANKEKFYSLIEFPYPSGAGLHVGHPRPFTAMDVMSRKRRMQGYNVLYPVGFDAFGLPTENYAIKTGRPPAEVTQENIANFTRQLQSLGFGFDWSRVVDTTDPKYFKWTQWIFLQLHKHGLAYKKNVPINWCLSCKIGLANEEIVDGKCERCGGEVEKRDKEQWMLAITKYADSLLEGLQTVDYIKRAKVQQQNWIGRSEGSIVHFQVSNSDEQISVFTTRPDTLFGVTYMVLAPEHELVESLKSEIKNKKSVEEYIQKAKMKSDLERTELQKEKTGVVLEGVTAVNPVNGEEVPVWIADYVLASYGTGAIMAVPGHDERDYEFAKQYGLEIRQVVARDFGERGEDEEKREGAYGILEKEGKILVMYEARYDLHRLPGGTIESGESEVEALLREFGEETGYVNAVAGERLGTVQVHFKSSKRKSFTRMIRTGYAVSLKNDEQAELAEEDKGAYEYLWLTKEEALEAFEKNKASSFNPHDTGEGHLVKYFFDGYSEPVIDKNGVVVNSDLLNGLWVDEAKEKIITWLEEHGHGSRETQFKLRDWVFSRQRYWGEPIPLVHCDSCKNKKYHYVLLHGYGGDSNSNFFPKLKATLEAQGHTVYLPDLPNTDQPNVEEQADFVLAGTEITENTIIAGHSHGGPVAMRILEKIDTEIEKMIVLDGFIRPEFVDARREAVEKSHGWEFDVEKIKNNAREIVVVADNQFPIIGEEQHKEMAQIFDAGFVRAKAQARHFMSADELEIEALFEQTGWIPVPEDQLPLELPQVEKYEPTDTGESPLAAIEEWVKTECPQCGGPARRETDVMPNWAGSSWYWLRYMDPKNTEQLASKEALDYWGQVDWYNGGMEHTVLHLLYSRFWNQFLFDIGAIPHKEPYAKRTSHGMILAEDGEKMSKSRGNVVNPDEMIEGFGADTLRTYIMFMGPFDQAVAWDMNGLVGVRRFLDRVWNLNIRITNDTDIRNTNIEALVHKTIKKVGEDIDEMKYNTAIAKMMELTNEMMKEQSISEESFKSLVMLLSPFAPHMCEELWEKLGNTGSIAYAPWPECDESKIVEDTITLVIQINGKVRGDVEVAADIDEADAKAQALAHENVVKWLDGKEPKKVIYVKGRLVSIVV